MERFLLDTIPISATTDEILKTLLLDDEDDINLITGMFTRAKELARPKALYKVAYVDEINSPHVILDGVRFTSAVLAHNMEGVHRVFAYICTCGTEVDDWSHNEKDYIVGLWLDIIKERILLDARNFLRNYIMQKYGIKTISSINPGSGNADTWPITQQQQLFPLIGGVTEDTGVRLTESCLMLPTKSTSGLLYGSDREFINCSLCERKNCHRRLAEYKPG